MDKLCIAIPTYNRGRLVEAQVKRLLPQLVPGVRIHIFDNASTDDTRELLAPFLGENVLLTTSSANVGMAGNICKAIEDAEAEWVWVLGDDDPVRDDAVARSERFILDSGTGVIEFDSMGGQISRDLRITSLAGLYEHHDPLFTLFISSHIFHKESISPHLGILAPAAFTFGPHTALIIRMLEAGGRPLHLRRESLLQPTKTVKGWSSLEVALGLSVLPEFIKATPYQKIAAGRLLIDICWMMSFGLREVTDADSAHRWKRIYKQTTNNLKCYRSTTILPTGDQYRRPKRSELKDFLICSIARFCPAGVLVRLGARFRNRHSHDRGNALRDF